MPKMAATTSVVAAAAASVLALVGVKKVCSAITAQRGLTLPSLRAANLPKCAYPEDYYPGTPTHSSYPITHPPCLPPSSLSTMFLSITSSIDAKLYSNNDALLSYAMDGISCRWRVCRIVIWRDPLFHVWT